MKGDATDLSEPHGHSKEEILLRLEIRGRSKCERYVRACAQVERSCESQTIVRLSVSDAMRLVDLQKKGWTIFAADPVASRLSDGVLVMKGYGIYVDGAKPRRPGSQDDIDGGQMGGAWWNV